MRLTRSWNKIVIAFVIVVFSGIAAFQLRDTNGCKLLANYLHRTTPPRTLVHAAPGVSEFILKEYNTRFARTWKCNTGETVNIKQLYGASGDQMRSIIAGNIRPDVIMMSNPYEMDTIREKTGLVAANWREDFPFQSSPYYSAVVFLVRTGNPKHIKDWEDLASPGLTILTSNPTTCGGGRWVYTAALGHGLKTTDTKTAAQEYVANFYRNVPVLYANQGDAGDAFLNKHIGDVYVTYESAAVIQALQEDAHVEIVRPSHTVAMDIPVAIATKNTTEDNTTDLARAYLAGLYDPETQTLVTQHYFHPRISGNTAQPFPLVPEADIFTRSFVFGSDNTIELQHLGIDGLFNTRIAPTK